MSSGPTRFARGEYSARRSIEALDSDLFSAVNYARQQAGVSVISMSWGSNDNLANQQIDQTYSSQYLVTPSGHQGITFVAAAGDHGVPNFPAESPNVRGRWDRSVPDF